MDQELTYPGTAVNGIRAHVSQLLRENLVKARAVVITARPIVRMIQLKKAKRNLRVGWGARHMVPFDRQSVTVDRQSKVGDDTTYEPPLRVGIGVSDKTVDLGASEAGGVDDRGGEGRPGGCLRRPVAFVRHADNRFAEPECEEHLGRGRNERADPHAGSS